MRDAVTALPLVDLGFKALMGALVLACSLALLVQMFRDDVAPVDNVVVQSSEAILQSSKTMSQSSSESRERLTADMLKQSPAIASEDGKKLHLSPRG